MDRTEVVSSYHRFQPHHESSRLAAPAPPHRCYPPLPPCQNPKKCLASAKKGSEPCASAVSILGSKGRLPNTYNKGKNPLDCSCGGKAKNREKALKKLEKKKQKAIKEYLKVKAKERALSAASAAVCGGRCQPGPRDRRQPGPRDRCQIL
ncbi:hypothetical protein JYU34_021335 [Plutella xylostella]|uniref:Uncharacterized protein n=1 Tax=Plutella xylostella TaxID=51655 RepID=A0ABQ7PTL2_PLUXY|nr:hypothetical protein JYU34_021335 [Plutella xylostella]